MRKFYKQISCLLGLLFSIMMQGQDLPSLPVAREIQRGSLPDGIQFYLVTNSAQKGFADYALVQRGRRESSGAREALRELPHFGERAPYRFLADHGVGYSDQGLVSHPSDATLFAFHDVPVHQESVADSTLLMLFELAAQWQQPQAIIICGDIDPARIRERMELLSMTVPQLEYHFQGDAYAWNPRDTVSVLVRFNTTGDFAALNAIYSAQRLPREVMNTPQPLVTQAFADQLGEILRNRVERSFRSAGIPLGGFRYRYHDSSRGPGDEYHSLTVYTSARQFDAATRLFASILSSLDKEGAGLAEFRDARERMIAERKRAASGAGTDNAAYLEQCVASYLYGAHLASEATVSSFLTGRRLEDEREQELFNGFARALLDSTRNLTLRYDIPEQGTDSRGILSAFNAGWAASRPAEDYSSGFGDMLRLHQPRTRVRVRSESQEPVSGGRLWTFSNGIKVISKRLPGTGTLHYALMLRGGVDGIRDLQEGESAFISDLLSLREVAGVSGADFHDMLARSGITMTERATLSDLRICGSAPAAEFPLLMRALLSVADGQPPSKEAFAYYKDCERIRVEMEALSPRDVNSLMDSIIRPSYHYTDRKAPDRLRDDLPERAEAYFDALFDKVGDGVLVLVGDFEEDAVKKELCRTLGDFRTQKGISQRTHVESRFATGSTTRIAEAAPGTVGGGEIGVNVALSADVPFNMDNYMAFLLGCELVRQRLAAVLADQGATAGLSGRLEIFPAERLTLYINCHPCPEGGLPAGVAAQDPLTLLEAVRHVTRQLASLPVPQESLKAQKELLIQQMEARRSDPALLLEDLLVRYSEGKDVVSDRQAAIRRVTAADVTRILKLLSQGAEVEYVII